MKHLLAYMFLLVIVLNMLLSLAGWYQSNHEIMFRFNNHTQFIDTIWQGQCHPQITEKQDNLISTPVKIVRFKETVNAIISARPAFLRYYVDFYGFIQRMMGRSYMEDANKGNDVVKYSNGQLNFIGDICSIDTCVGANDYLECRFNAIKSLKTFISENSNSNLYFIIEPNKGVGILPYTISFDNTKESVDTRLSSTLTELKIPYLDLNEGIPENREIAFYNTDHHWRIEYAFSQLPIICDFLGITDTLYNEEHFKMINTHRQFIGSLAKRTGNYFSTLTDTCKYYVPNFDTSIKADYYSTSQIKRRCGTLEETLLFKEFIEDKTFDSNLYDVCNHGDNPLVRIDNLSPLSNETVLLIGDSFSAPLITYLSLSFRHMDCVDLRSNKNCNLYKMISDNAYDKIIFVYPEFYNESMFQFQ